MKCPICNKTVDPDSPNASPPFCSTRCKMIDAKRWLCEEYAIETVNLEELEKEILENEGGGSGSDQGSPN